MTDIFARKPVKEIKNVPSLRYDVFIKAFERGVAAAQSRIRAIEAMEQPYNLVREALETVKLPNDTKLTLSASVVSVQIKAIQTDCMAVFEEIIKQIGNRLLAHGLHRGGIPSVGDAGWWPQRTYNWRMRDVETVRSVDVNLEIPEDGIADLEVVRTVRMSESVDYELKPRSAHRTIEITEDAQ